MSEREVQMCEVRLVLLRYMADPSHWQSHNKCQELRSCKGNRKRGRQNRLMSEVTLDVNHLGNWQVLRLEIKTGAQGKIRCRRAFSLGSLLPKGYMRSSYGSWHPRIGRDLE